MLLKIIIAIFFFIIGLANGYGYSAKEKTEKRYTNYLYELQSKLDKTKK